MGKRKNKYEEAVERAAKAIIEEYGLDNITMADDDELILEVEDRYPGNNSWTHLNIVEAIRRIAPKEA